MQELEQTSYKHSLVPLHKAVEPGINVAALSYPFTTKTQFFIAKEGQNIVQILEQLLQFSAEGVYAHVYVNETYIPRSYWTRVYPKEGCNLTIKILPGKGKGKKNPLATILSIAVIAAAAWAGPALAAALGGAASLGTTGALVVGALGSAAVNAIGSLLVSAIAPPPKQRMNSNSPASNVNESQSLFIEGARNTADPYGVVPVILGKHRYVPKLGANTFTQSSGRNQFVTQLFVWGMGKYELENLRIGETPLEQFEDYTIEHFLNGEGSDGVTALYPNSIFQEDLSVEVTQAGGWQQRTTQPGCDSIIVDITFPQGLCAYNSQNGARGGYSVTIEIEYSVAGAATWLPLASETISDSTNTALRKEYAEQTGGGQYDVRVRRITGDTSDSNIFDDTYWTALRTVTFENPIAMKGLSWSVIKMKATDQLNGAIDQLNADLTLIAPSYNYLTGLWVEAPTRNPADLFRFVAQNSALFYDGGEALVDSPNARPLADGRIDLVAIEDFHDFCRIRGFEYNAPIDYETTVWDQLNEIASAGRGRVTLVDGKWSVIIDREQSAITQHVTPANSWGLSVRKVFPEVPHAFRVQFINEEVGYFQDEMLVYADGYDKNTARKITGLQLPGITKPSLIYQHAREHLASITLRPHEYTFNMDVEHLVVNRGGLIKFAHDVPLIGIEQGYLTGVTTQDNYRLTDIDGIRLTDDDQQREVDEEPAVVAVTLDRPVIMEVGKSYSIRFRSASTNVSVYCPVITVPGETTLITFTTPIIGESPIATGDLFMFGLTGRETIDLIVRDIVPGEDFTARIVAVDASPQIFEASQGVIPPFDSKVTIPSSLLRPLPPEIVSIQTGASAQIQNQDGSISSRMIITLQNNNGFDVITGVKIKASDMSTFEDADVTQATAERVIIQNLVTEIRYDIQLYYKKVLTGAASGLGGTAYSPIVQRNLVLFEGLTDRPPDITNFVAQPMGAVLGLSWDAVNVIDFRYYEIRYSPNISGVSWYTAVVIKTGLTNSETIVPAGTGTYLIKAFDRDGNESQNATPTSLVIVDERFNAVEIVDEDPIFPGNKTNTLVDSSRLELDDYTLPGEYEFDDYIDLGDVFTARIIGHITAAGRAAGNTMSVWPNLSSLGTLDGGAPANWYASILVSTTVDDPTGSPVWTPYEPLTTTTLAFRAVRAKVIMEGNGTNVTPSIEELRLVVDMEDRIEKALNVTVPNTGLSVVYVDEFNATPTLVAVLLDGQEGDVVAITNETAAGFDYIVTNGGIGVTRHINYHVIGYGRKTI